MLKFFLKLKKERGGSITVVEMRQIAPNPDAEVTLREVTADTVRAICELRVADNQKHLVTPNAVSIAEAYFREEAWFRAIYANETPVGFVMLYEVPKYGSYAIWRFMIDARYQRRGYGRRAMQLVLRRIRSRPKAKALTLHVVRAEDGPAGFYRKFGFEFTGRIEPASGQHEMKLDL
jgi:diamine N-acetyltransferase